MIKPGRSISLLIVEDNPGDYVLVEEFVNEQFNDPTFTHASTAAEAESFLISGERNFDTILLDLSLPDKSGEDLIRDMLSLADSIPIIVLTGFTDLSFSIKTLSLGASDYLLKEDLSSALLFKSITYSLERSAFSSKIIESEKKYRNLFKMTPLPMMLFALDTLEFLDVNDRAVDHYGYSREEFLAMTVRDIKPESNLSEFESRLRNYKGVLAEGALRGVQHKKKNGEEIEVEITGSDLLYNGRECRIVIAEDVTVKRKEQHRLKLFESVIVNTTESIVIMEAEPTDLPGRKILYVNQAFLDTTGYSREEVLGETLSFLKGKYTDNDVLEELRLAMDNYLPASAEFINYRKNGEEFWMSISGVPVADADGQYSHWVIIGRDISNRKLQEADLRSSLKEKETLLAEIHHRVKNNLAVVSAMMQLQAFEADNDVLSRSLYDSVGRIKAMANIHEHLYSSESFSNLNFSESLQGLVTGIVEAVPGGIEIQTEFELESVLLNINQAVPCSLITNEVVTNAIKHAFNEQNHGKLKIRLSESDKHVQLLIEDDGSGLPDNFETIGKGSLGLQLIELLAQQLKAEQKYESTDSGTRFILDFEKANAKGSVNAHIFLR